MAKEADVRAKITVEDNSTSVLKRIKDAFMGSSDAAEKAESKAGSFLEQIGATAIGQNLVPMLGRVKELGVGFFQAGIEAQSADQAVSGLIASVQGIPWRESFAGAVELGDRLDDVAIKAGQLKSDVKGAFQALLEFGSASQEGIDSALKQTTQITTVANVLGKSAEGLAREFGMMGDGMLRTRGILFQLLQPTGIFSKDTTKAAEQWSKMTEASRAQSLAYGLEQVSSRLAKATPTIGDYLNTITNLKTVAVEKFGEPLARSLEPALKKAIDRMQAALPVIERLGKSLSKDVGKWVEDAADKIEEGFKYLETHQEEIKKTIVDAWTMAKETVQWILSHKEELALAFGAYKAAPLVGGGMRLAGSLAGAASAGIPSLGIAGTGATGFAAGAGTFLAFGAAVSAFALAVDQWQSLMTETEGGKSEKEQDQSARERALRSMIESPEVGIKKQNLKAFEDLRKAYVETATELGENSRAAGDLADKAWASYRAVRGMVEPAEQAAKMMDQFQKSLQAGMIPDEASIETQQQLIDQVATGFEAARQKQNVAALQYIADVMLKSEGLRNAFLSSANMASEGFEVLAELVEGKSEEFATALRARAAEGKGAAATMKAPAVVFKDAKFEIKQDFRDQDPDRVAIVFERDIRRMTEQRIQASTSSPFGL